MRERLDARRGDTPYFSLPKSAMATNSDPLKAAWERARVYAAEHGLSLRKARSILAQQPKPVRSKSATQSAKRALKTADQSPLKGASRDLATAEKQLRTKYPHIVAGTIAVHINGAYKGRRTVEILCQAAGCQSRRTVHTSDLFQVTRCVECTKDARRRRRLSSN